VEKAHYHGPRQRLRERFLRSGLDSFADYEALELLLTLAIPRKDVKVPAKLVIERCLLFPRGSHQAAGRRKR
jgi:DNA repair protein RadC